MRIYDIPTVGERSVIFEKTFRVASISADSVEMYYDDYCEVREFTVSTFGLYLENNENIDKAVTALADRQMAPKTIAGTSITGINKMMEVFIPLFRVIGIGLYIFVIFYLISSAINEIKSNYFQIGVMRSFGAKSTDVGFIFIAGVVLTGLAIVVMTILFEPLIVSVYNKLIIESFSMILNTYAYDITLVDRSLVITLSNSLLVITITSISALISLVTLKRLKPIEIIRAKKNGGEVA